MTGTTAHSSQVFRSDIGPGAIFEASRILNGFREKLAGEEHLTFNPGLIVGGTGAEHMPAEARGSATGKDNVVAANAVVTGDLRVVERAVRPREEVDAGGGVGVAAAHPQHAGV